MKATVVKHTGSHYLLSKLPEWAPFVAVTKGRLRLAGSESTNPIAVGDIVEYEEGSDKSGGEKTCTIKKIEPRKNCIVRRSTNLSRVNHVIAANIDCVFLIVTLREPETKPQFVDRFLVTCEAYGVPVVILVNKSDIYLPGEVSDFAKTYEDIGYKVLETSVVNGLNVDELRELCKGKVVLFSGQSGVGKSSLISALDPSLKLKTAKISEAHQQGKHTTTFYEMHPLSCGGFVVDTPGIRGFGLVDFSKEELSNYFPEMLRIEDNCKFIPCTHTHEPGCAVKAAVEEGKISVERYLSYLAMLEDDGKYRAPEE
ncbi:MAG: ribosome small subunit-dependent GTPase A [Candidatus Egerieousia sp.]